MHWPLLMVYLLGARGFASDATLGEAWVPVGAVADADSAAFSAEGVAWIEGQPMARVVLSRASAEALKVPVIWIRSDHRRGAPPQGYRDPEAGHVVLMAAAAQGRAGRVVLGASLEGRPLEALWLGQPPSSGAPSVRVLGAHHGDELMGFELALALVEMLSAGDGVVPEITALLDQRTVWVMPYVNPDGVMAGSRYNAGDVDLNRNYDLAWSADGFRVGEAPFSEPETQAVRTLALAGGPPMLSLSLHGGAENIGYVWNYTYQAPPAEGRLVDLAQAYVDACDLPGFYATNGAEWYVTNGDTNDWSFGRYGGLDFTVEVSQRKGPDPSEIDAYVAAHLDAVLGFIEAPIGLSGVVRDAASGRPLQAELVWSDAQGEVRFFTDPAAGRFARVNLQGPGSLRVDAVGWQPVTLELSAPRFELDVALQPDSLIGPGVVSQAGRSLHLAGALGSEITLTRPGFPSQQLALTQGTLSLPEDLPAGPWTLQDAQGQVWPHGLLLTDAPLDAVWSQEAVDFDAEQGVMAWALWGADRALVPLDVDWQQGRARVALAPVPVGENWQLLVLSDATWMAADSSNAVFPAHLRGPGGCACDMGGTPGALWWVPCLLFTRRRRS